MGMIKNAIKNKKFIPESEIWNVINSCLFIITLNFLGLNTHVTRT
jgi:hypothetical protein